MKLHKIRKQHETVIITLLFPIKWLGITFHYRAKHYIYMDPKSERFKWLSYPDYAPLELDDFMLEYLDVIKEGFTKGRVDTESLIDQKVYLIK